MKICLTFICTIVILIGSVQADEKIDKIYSLYSEGKIIEARDKYSELPQTTIRDGNRLFITALLDNNGREAINKIEAAIRSDLDGKYQEEAYFRLIQLAEAEGDKAKAVSAAKSFLDLWETSRYRENILAILAAYSPANDDRYVNLLNDEFGGSYYGRFARLKKATDAFNIGHYKTATKYCRMINNAEEDDLLPGSLILLSKIGLKNDNAERALFNYNILHEQYRNAIGEGELLDALRNVSESQSTQEAQEVFEGLSYSVKVGTFSDKDNAKRRSKQVEAYGYSSYITRRKISDKNYYVVMAGKFKTSRDAEIAKQKLEAGIGENELFRVITNDEE